MGKLTNLNPPTPIADADLPSSIARDAEYLAADAAHLGATDPHLQYPTQERGDIRYVRRFGQSFKAAPTVPQQIPASTATNVVPTKINFPTIISNIGNQFANSRLTALETETWQITTYILFDLPLNTSGRLILYLYKNGSLLDRRMDVTSQGGYWGVEITSSNILLTTGQYVEIYATIFASNGKIYGDANLDACWAKGIRVG